MVAEEIVNQVVGLLLIGCLFSGIMGVMLGIMIKHYIDLPYILACKFAKGDKSE